MPVPFLGIAAKAIGGAFTKKAIAGAAKGAVKRGIGGKAKDFITGKNRKKKGTQATQGGDGGAIVRAQSAIIPTRSVDTSGGSSLAVYSPPSSTQEESVSTSFSSIEKSLDRIVGKTATLEAAVKNQYKTKKRLSTKLRVAADKERKKEREEKSERGGLGKFFGGAAKKVVSKATKGPLEMLWSFITNVLMGGLLLRVVDLIQKNGVMKGLSLAGANYLIWRRAFALIKGGFVSLFRLGKTVFNDGFKTIGEGFKSISSSATKVAKTLRNGISSLGRAIVLFARKSFAFVSTMARGLLKGKKVADAAKVATKVASKVKSPKVTPKAANTIKPFTRGTSGTKAATKGVTSATKGVVGKAAGKFRGLGKLLPGLKFGGKVLRRVPIIGPLLVLGINLLDPEITVGRAAFRAAGAALGGGIAAALSGAASGGLLAVLGLMVGEIVGEYLGDIMWIGMKGGGLNAIGKKIMDDIKKTLNVGKQLYDWTVNGLGRFYEGMPKINLEDSLINSMSAVIPMLGLLKGAIKNHAIPALKRLIRFEGDFEIPDIGWMLNPFNVVEKFDIFRRAFFDDKPMQEGELKKTDKESDSGDSVSSESDSAPKRSEFPEGPEGDKQFEEATSSYESGGGASADFSGGGDAATKFYNQLISDGVPPAAAAGIVGNIEAESGFNPAAIEAGSGIGRGLIQWSYGRRTAFEKWSKDNNLDPDSMEANYGYLLHEMKGGDGNHWMPRKDTPPELVVRSYDEFLEKAKDPKTAAKLFMYNYERPAKATQHLDRRIKAAEGISKSAAESSTRDQSTSAQVSDQAQTGNAYASGLKTGPSSRIGGSSEYHIDTKFRAGMTMKQKVQMMDQLSMGYQQQGRVIEFSNNAVANETYSHDMSYEEKAKILNRAFAAHNLPRGRAIDQGGFNSIDYYVPLAEESRSTGGRGRFKKSVEQAEILVPSIEGGSLQYHKGGNYGSYVVGVDKDGKVLYKTGHGDTSTSADRGTVRFKKPTQTTPKLQQRQQRQPVQQPTRLQDLIKPGIEKHRRDLRNQEVSQYPSYESSGTDMIALLTPLGSDQGGSHQIPIQERGQQPDVSSLTESTSSSGHMPNKYYQKAVTAQLYKYG